MDFCLVFSFLPNKKAAESVISMVKEMVIVHAKKAVILTTILIICKIVFLKINDVRS